jgi:hypothetical protein
VLLEPAVGDRQQHAVLRRDVEQGPPLWRGRSLASTASQVWPLPVHESPRATRGAVDCSQLTLDSARMARHDGAQLVVGVGQGRGGRAGAAGAPPHSISR